MTRSTLKPQRNRRLARRLVAGILTLLVAGGCSQAWRPSPTGTEQVGGRILVGRQPVTGGWIEFIPIEGSTGRIRSAPVQPDGSFIASQVARGRNVLRIVNPPSSSRVESTFQSYQSPIRPVIGSGRLLEIDLTRPATWTAERPPGSDAPVGNIKKSF